ncbi:hypothetical protein D9M73_285170 [compost metagenome]
MPAAQSQRSGLQWRSKAGQVKEAHPIDATLERLPIGLFASQQLDPRVEKAPQPAAL